MKAFIVLSLITFITGCVTGRMNVTSFPSQSEVIIKDTRGEIKATGNTPYTLSLSNEFFSQTEFAILEIRKDGYLNQNFIIPKTFFAANHSLNVTLEALPVPETPKMEALDIDQCEQVSKKSLNALGKGIAIAQSNMMKQEWQIANIKLSDLISEFPFVSVLYDLQGNIYYLQKNFVKALEAYERSLAVDPQNVETAIMVRRLRQITGKRTTGGSQ